MRPGKRLWRTSEGDLVLDGDPRGAFLAYGTGDDVAPADEGKAKAALKQAEQPADKQADPAPNKGSKPAAKRTSKRTRRS